jgi:hypothetical protein
MRRTPAKMRGGLYETNARENAGRGGNHPENPLGYGRRGVFLDLPRRGSLGVVTVWELAEARSACGLVALVCVPPSMICCSLPSTVPLFSPPGAAWAPRGENENR